MWNQLPEKYDKWNSVYRFHLRLAHKGVFNELLGDLAERRNSCSFKIIDATHIKVHQDACRHSQPAEERALGKTKGGRNTKLHACVNGSGKVLFFLLRPGNEHEMRTAEEVLEDVDGKIILADRATIVMI